MVVRYVGLLDADYLCAKHFTLVAKGDGDDVIFDWFGWDDEGTDTLVFGSGITANDIKFSKVAEDWDAVRIQFVGEAGSIRIDGQTVSNDDGAADCVINMSFDDFLALASGQLDPMGAYMSGKMKIDGNPMDALALQPVLKG